MYHEKAVGMFRSYHSNNHLYMLPAKECHIRQSESLASHHNGGKGDGIIEISHSPPSLPPLFANHLKCIDIPFYHIHSVLYFGSSTHALHKV